MDLNLLSKYLNNKNSNGNSSISYENSLESSEKNTDITGSQCLNEAFSDELNKIRKNGFYSKIDAYKNVATDETTVAIGLFQEGIEENYVLVKNKWNDDKWDMNILSSDGKDGNLQPQHKMENSIWLASHGFTKLNPNQLCIEGLTIEEVLKLCE